VPAKSRAQQIATAIAEHHPEKLYERNKGLAQMSKSQLSDFASTSKKNLPYRVGKEPKPRPRRKRKTYGE
jgi:hypothetical protein